MNNLLVLSNTTHQLVIRRD